jgi:predicted Zn finger-like uncharacterized protein
MPEIITCPECAGKVRVPDTLLGKRVRCPRCDTAFVAPEKPANEDESERPRRRGRASSDHVQEEPPPRRRREEEDDDEEPRARRRRDRDEDEEDEEEEEERGRHRRRRERTDGDLRKVRTGLTFVLFSWIAAAVAVLELLVGLLLIGGLTSTMLSAKNGPMPSGAVAVIGSAVVVLLIFLIIYLVGQGLSITGLVFCLGAPSKHGAKMLAITALVLSILVVLSSCGSAAIGGLVSGVSAAQQQAPPPGMGGPNAMSTSPPPSGGSNPFTLVSYLLSGAEAIVFLFFLRALALNLRARRLASSAIYIVSGMGISVLLSCGVFCVGVMTAVGAGASAMSAAKNNQPAAMDNTLGVLAGGAIVMLILLAVVGLIWLALTIWNIVLTVQVRAAVSNAVD